MKIRIKQDSLMELLDSYVPLDLARELLGKEFELVGEDSGHYMIRAFGHIWNDHKDPFVIFSRRACEIVQDQNQSTEE